MLAIIGISLFGTTGHVRYNRNWFFFGAMFGTIELVDSGPRAMFGTIGIC